MVRGLEGRGMVRRCHEDLRMIFCDRADALFRSSKAGDLNGNMRLVGKRTSGTLEGMAEKSKRVGMLLKSRRLCTRYLETLAKAS